MKTFFFTLLLAAFANATYCQSGDSLISIKEVERIENILAGDEMQGRKAFTPGAEKAADFISKEFKKAGLQTFGNLKEYKQSFTVVKPKFKSVTASINGDEIDPKNVIAFTSQSDLSITDRSGYKKVYIRITDDLFAKASEFVSANENLLVFVEPSFSKNFGRLTFLKRVLPKTDYSKVFILGTKQVETFEIHANHDIAELIGSNVVGILNGKSKKDEYVIFSGHYDHLGIGKVIDNDSIFNGANDNASGIAAIISLAKYYSSQKQNQRSLVFVAFTAEEMGGFGSAHFSRQINPEKVVAMFNLEMIGTESKWGKNAAYVTGFTKSTMGTILQNNLKGSHFTFHPDPYPEQHLFYRSDNATLAKLGVPAHTISTSKMDNEPNYHKLSDEVSTLDLGNMTEIIKSVVISAQSIISGSETPTRVKGE